MGLRFLRRGGGDPADNLMAQRFGACFPRAFAYAYNNLGDESAARETVGDAFCRAFVEPAAFDDSTFRTTLFSLLRALCRERRPALPLDIGLAAPERDVVTLMFDAGLTTDEVSQVLAADDAPERLTSALRKMRNAGGPAVIPSFFRV